MHYVQAPLKRWTSRNIDRVSSLLTGKMCVLFSHTPSKHTDLDQVWKKLVNALFPVLCLLRVDDGGIGDGVDATGSREEELVEDIFADDR